MNAPKLAERIAALEIETAQAWEAITAAEIGLSKVIADGGDRDKAYAVLEKARTIATGSVAALKRLDVEYFEIASREYEEAIKNYNGNLEKEFNRIGTEAEKAMKPLEKVLAGAFSNPREKLAELHSALLQSVWTGLQETFGAKYNDIVPKPPANVEPRNNFGVRMTQQEQDSGFTSQRCFEAVPVKMKHSAPLREWWKE